MIKVEIVTPKGVAHTQDCEETTIPTTTGMIGVRTGHLPLVTTLKPGVVTLKDGKSETEFTIDGGFAEILPEMVSIVTRHADKR